MPVPLSRLQPSRMDAIEDWPWLAHQGALIGAGMEGDAPADPALAHIVKNLDLGHGHNGGGPDPVRRRARAGQDPMQSHPKGNRVLWRPARGTLARAPQHGEGRRRLDPRPPDHAHADLNHSSVEAALEAISGS